MFLSLSLCHCHCVTVTVSLFLPKSFFPDSVWCVGGHQQAALGMHAATSAAREANLSVACGMSGGMAVLQYRVGCKEESKMTAGPVVICVRLTAVHAVTHALAWLFGCTTAGLLPHSSNGWCCAGVAEALGAQVALPLSCATQVELGMYGLLLCAQAVVCSPAMVPCIQHTWGLTWQNKQLCWVFRWQSIPTLHVTTADSNGRRRHMLLSWVHCID